VLVNNGATTVIGGIYVEKRTDERKTARLAFHGFRCLAGCSGATPSTTKVVSC
jgi:hypothetical protein